MIKASDVSNAGLTPSKQALDLLSTYLTDSEVAPLAKEFIEIAQPLCTSIDFYSEDRTGAAELTCSISGVPYASLDDIAGKVKSCLRQLFNSQDIDMDRMSSVIRRDKRKLLAQAESSVTGVLTNAIVSGVSLASKVLMALSLIWDACQTFCTETLTRKISEDHLTT